MARLNHDDCATGLHGLRMCVINKVCNPELLFVLLIVFQDRPVQAQ